MEKIKLNFAFLCDNAFFSEGGKLNLIGIFKTISSKSLPVIHPQIFVVANVDVQKGKEYKETIKIVDEDGKNIQSPIDFVFSIDRDSPDSESGFMGQFNGLKFEKEGMYALKILIDDEVIGSIPFEVKLIK